MDITIQFNDQRRFVTVKVNYKPRDNLLPPKVNAQLTRPQFLPKNLFGGGHITAQFTGAFQLFFGHSLTRNDVFDWHFTILIENPSPASPKGEEPIASNAKHYLDM